VDTGVVTRAVTNQGSYQIPFLLPGTYRVEAECTGLRPDAHRRRAAMEDTLRLDIRLEVGSVSEVVNVTAEAPLVDETSGNIGQVMTPAARCHCAAAARLGLCHGARGGDERLSHDGPWNIDQA
jgi:hypothetical protein